MPGQFDTVLINEEEHGEEVGVESTPSFKYELHMKGSLTDIHLGYCVAQVRIVFSFTKKGAAVI